MNALTVTLRQPSVPTLSKPEDRLISVQSGSEYSAHSHKFIDSVYQIRSDQSLSRVQLFVTP